MVMFTGQIDREWNGGDEEQSYSDYIAAQVPYGAGSGETGGGVFITPPVLPSYDPAPYITPRVEVQPVTGPALKLETGGDLESRTTAEFVASQAPPITGASDAATAPAASPAAQVAGALGKTQKTALVIGGVVLLVIILYYVFMPSKKAA